MLRTQRKVGWTSLVVQWLGLNTSNARGKGLIPDPGTKIPHAAQHGQKIKKILNILRRKEAGEIVDSRRTAYLETFYLSIYF